MNAKNNPTVTRGPWNYGSMSGSGIDGSIVQPVRFWDSGRPRPMLKGQLYGLRVTGDYDARHAEIDRLGLLYGYTQRYGRNTCGFVQSRAARRRGYKTADRLYLDRAAHRPR